MIRLGLECVGWRVMMVQDRTPGWRKYWHLVKKHRVVRDEYDVMVVCFPGQTAMLLARLISRKPIVFDAFTSLYDSDVYDRAVVRPHGFGAWWRFLLDFFSMHLANFVLVDTEAQREYYTRAFRLRSDRIGVLPVGSVETIMQPLSGPTAFSAPGQATNSEIAPQRDFTVHFHGHFIPLQGVRVILGAARELARESVRFSIIGRGQQYGEMRRLAASWDLQNVRFEESVPYEELPERMVKADVCLGIFGATAKGARVVPNKAYEAIACAKPLITQDSPASREVFTDGVDALLVPSEDPAALAAAIRRLRDDPVLRDRIARAGHKLFLREFTTVRIGERLVGFVEQAAALKNQKSKIKEQKYKSKIKNPTSALLLVIVVAAFLLRVVGISYGLPYRLVGDEETFVGGALKMLELKQLVPALAGPAFAPFYLPPLIYYAELVLFLPVLGLQYLFSGAQSLAEFRQEIALDPTVVWLAARFMSVVLGTVSVGVLYFIGRDLFNRRAGLIAAALLATSFFAASLSHFARHWPPSLLVLLLGLWMSVKIRSGLRQGLAPRALRHQYLAAGLLAGLGFGIDYVSVLGLLFVLTAHVTSGREAWSARLRSANLWLAVTAAIALSAFSIVLHQSFSRILVREAGAAAAVKSVGGFFAVFGYYAQVLWAYEPLILVAGLAGLGYLFWRDRRIVVFLAVFTVAYLLAFYLFMHQEVRYALFLLPVLILAAAAFIDYLLERWPVVTWPAFVIPVAFAAAILVRFDFLLLRTDTRLLAKQYIEAYVPAGANIVSLLRGVRLTPSRASLEAQAALDPTSLRSFDRALLAVPETSWPQSRQPRYELTNLHFLSDAAASSALAQFLQQPGRKFALVQYQSLIEITPATKTLRDRSRLLKAFVGRQDGASRDFLGNDLQPVWAIFSFDRLGPIVELREID
ncbi:glycosyltransferase [Candidatus Parcubacteria bacterium]|nr:glycosyltransferase [Candidatus Parcubacteria bacterium]